MIPRVCLLGSSGNVACGIISAANKNDLTLVLATRGPKRVQSFLDEYAYDFEVISLTSVETQQFDIIINAAGVCDPQVIKDSPELLFESHQSVDELVLRNLKNFPKTLFFNLSSGAVYGTDFTRPAPMMIDQDIPVQLEDISGNPGEMYSQTKVFFEKKHRSLKEFNIVDIRLFSIFHRHLNLDGHYFMAQLVKCLLAKITFVTSSQNLVKDYAHPIDLINLALTLWHKGQVNCAIDLRSSSPVKKTEIIEFFKEKYQLKVDYQEMQFLGTKLNYYSTSGEAESYGFKAFGSSLDCITQEVAIIIKQHQN